MNMRFIRRYQYQILFMAVLFFCSVMVIRGFRAESAAHVERREDFLLLCEKGQGQSAQRLYQVLVQELPGLNDRLLAEDLQRTAMLVELKKPELDNLIWKFHVSVHNELRQRAEHRLAEAQDNDK